MLRHFKLTHYRVFRQLDNSANATIPPARRADAMDIKKGDKVRITSGTFQGHEGKVDSVDREANTASVILDMYGRPTPVQVECRDLESA
jgi:transcription antitermination factor NusG